MTKTKLPDRITEIMLAVSLLAEELGVQKINQLPAGVCWTQKIDEHWTIAVNGHKEPADVNIAGTMGCDGLLPYHMAVFHNGWLAGIVSPAGGTMLWHSETAFMKAIEERIAVEKLAKEMQRNVDTTTQPTHTSEHE